MPELPEVHTIVNDLADKLPGYRIDNVEIAHGYETCPNNQFYAQQIVNSQIEQVNRLGKNIVIKLAAHNFLIFHLAMTGRILLKTAQAPKNAHQKVQLKLSKKEDTLFLRFCDQRMFGKTEVLNAAELDKLKQKYGPDLVTSELTPENFLKRLQLKKTPVKNALLEQAIVAGLGNIYATDALWLAGIHPETNTQALTSEQAQKLLSSAKTILLEGISHRGSTLPDEAYVDIFGRPGNHQAYFRVYGRSVCLQCKTGITFKKISGRGTYFCPVCQK
ncbi:bifunctional DNA-formamidopyrimidine glycosylase/DNA-(apurinic or apyrimidinic site) lyase [Patescibacteria group bacterium]|nr:bifunctional DNA-formamidopyrimidine glycosylase/DNA-(apurinic or apyrimidinic site) lyase [Patescibacteria group bacterium]